MAIGSEVSDFCDFDRGFRSIIRRRTIDYLYPILFLVWWKATTNAVAAQATIWAEQHSDRRKARWVSRLCGCAFVMVSGLYFHLCRKLGMSIEWGFLSALLPGFPFAAAAGFVFVRPVRYRNVIDGLCALVSFSAYFWSGALFIKWWMRVGS